MRRSSFLGLLGLGACGLVGGDAATVPVASEGVGAFGDAAPIEICKGRSLVTPDASGLGACVAAGSAGKVCAADPDCSGNEACFCGRCIVRVCAGVTSCGAGQVCRSKRCARACVTASDCASDEDCGDGGCARRCASDGDCSYGERCDALDQRCGTKACSDVMPCGAGEACEKQATYGEPHEPTFARIGDADLAYFELRGASDRAIYRARIVDARHWVVDPEAPVLSDPGGLGAPSAIASDGAVDLFFEVGDAKGVGHASSNDGLAFVRDAELLAPSLAWEAGRVGSPGAARFRGETLVFYEGGQGEGIGLARFDGSVFVRASDAPVATLASIEDPTFWRGVTEVGAPYALALSGDRELFVYFTARGVEASDAVGASRIPAERNDSIGLLATTDLALGFSRFPLGPVFAQVSNLRGHLGEREAAVRLGAKGAEITFVSSDASGSNVNGLARAARE